MLVCHTVALNERSFKLGAIWSGLRKRVVFIHHVHTSNIPSSQEAIGRKIAFDDCDGDATRPSSRSVYDAATASREMWAPAIVQPRKYKYITINLKL